MAQNSIPGAAPTTTLLAAYLAARYRVQLDDGRWLALEVGRLAPALLEWALPGTSFSLVSAWNPQSIMLAPSTNEAADTALRLELDALGLAKLRTVASEATCGHDRRPDWREPGWLVAGLDATAADGLALRHGQVGILHWRPGERVRLRMYRARPAADVTLSCVDWVPL